MGRGENGTAGSYVFVLSAVKCLESHTALLYNFGLSLEGLVLLNITDLMTAPCSAGDQHLGKPSLTQLMLFLSCSCQDTSTVGHSRLQNACLVGQSRLLGQVNQLRHALGFETKRLFCHFALTDI